jgi:hypothetical protein
VKEVLLFGSLFLVFISGYLFINHNNKASVESQEPTEEKIAASNLLEENKIQPSTQIDESVNIENRKNRLNNLISLLGLDDYQVIDECDSCLVHKNDVYLYDKDINKINVVWESSIRFKINTTDTDVDLLSLISKLEEYNYTINDYEGFVLASAGGATGNSEVLSNKDVPIEKAELVKIYEKHILTKESGESLNNWEVDYNTIEISVPDLIDLSKYID